MKFVSIWRRTKVRNEAKVSRDGIRTELQSLVPLPIWAAQLLALMDSQNEEDE